MMVHLSLALWLTKLGGFGEGGGGWERKSYESGTYPLNLPLKRASFNSPLNTPTKKIVHFSCLYDA